MTQPTTPSAPNDFASSTLPCGHTLKEHTMMQEARDSAGLEGARTDKTICELLDLAKGHEKPSAPLTPEEVERWLAETAQMIPAWKRQDRILEQEPGAGTAVELLMRHIRTLRTRAEQAEAQLQSYREDAERMAGALEKCKTLVPDRTVDCRGDKCRLPNCEACWSTAKEYVRTAAARFIDATLSSLNNQYPQKP